MSERDEVRATAAAPERTLRIDADLTSLTEVRAFVRTAAADLGADDTETGDLVQAVDEWVTNIIRHGYGGGHGPVEVELDREGQDIVVRVRDRAQVFDPANAPAFDPGAPLEARRPGGMGIHLMRDLMGSITHRRLPGGGNELTMHRVCRSANTGGGA